MNIRIGDKYNNLTVVGIGHKQNYKQFYYVQCDCGSPVIEVCGYRLKDGTTKSCGCLRKKIGAEIGKIYGSQNGRKAGLSRRKHFGCMICGSDKHYAKGMCRSCYDKSKRGTL